MPLISTRTVSYNVMNTQLFFPSSCACLVDTLGKHGTEQKGAKELDTQSNQDISI